METLLIILTLPILLNPSNNSTISQTSPKLSWDYSGECYTKGSCFYIEVDDSENFPSIDKSTYTNNKYYTPQNLPYKKWFWHVKAKNPSGVWSAMSNTWSFTIANTPANTPASETPTPTPSPTPVPTPIPTPQISPSPAIFTPSPQPTAKEEKISAYQILAARATQNQTSTVAAVVAKATPSILPTTSPVIKIISTKQVNIFKIAGVIFLFAGITILIFISIKLKIKSEA